MSLRKNLLLISAARPAASGSTVPFDFITQERTDVVFSDFEFEQLSAAAVAQNENRFCKVADTINWKFRSPGDFVTAVQFGLTAGAYQKAFQLTQMGITLYPDHTELQKYASILAPAKVKREIQPSQPDGIKDIQWLKVHRSEYTGQWVALLRGELLGTAPTLKELIRQVGNPKGTQILVTQVN
ncbi:MAG: hypothetical protein AB9907_15745 [Flexilinea sp.]